MNSPLRTYKRFTSDSQTSYVSKTQCNVNKKNVYVGFVTADSLPENLKADRNSLNPGDYFLHCWNGQGAVEAGVNNSFLKSDVEYTLATPGYSNFKANYDISYCTIPYNYNNVKMYKKNTVGGKEWCEGSDNTNVDTYNTVLWFHWDNKFRTVYEQTKVNGELAKAAGISSFYSNAEAVVGKTFDLSAKAQGTVTYTSSDKKVATVNKKSGFVTAKKPGKVQIKVTAAATSNYKKGTGTITLIVVPATPTVQKAAAYKTKAIKVSYKKASGASGYQITYATNKSFKNAKSVSVSSKKTSAVIKNLKKGKNYYVKVRSYKKIGGKKYYSVYSKVKTVKTK